MKSFDEVRWAAGLKEGGRFMACNLMLGGLNRDIEYARRNYNTEKRLAAIKIWNQHLDELRSAERAARKVA
jgi:hypothetical protein